MRVFIHEFFCGGGLLGQNLEHAPIVEGGAMLRATVDSFSQVPGVETFSLVDYRIADLFGSLPNVTVVEKNYRSNYCSALDRCDAALVISPETGGELKNHLTSILHRGKINFGSTPETIVWTGDKFLFWQMLTKVGINSPQTEPVTSFFEPSKVFIDKWISKPIDGVGCNGVSLHQNGSTSDYTGGVRLIAQEYVEGDPMSLSIISSPSHDLILSVNRQHVTQSLIGDRQVLSYNGGEILSVEPDRQLKNLVKRIKSTFPQLSGYWGLDYIDSVLGPVVIEINPRITTSFTALVKALDQNPAQLIMLAATGGDIDVGVTRSGMRFGLDGMELI